MSVLDVSGGKPGSTRRTPREQEGTPNMSHKTAMDQRDELVATLPQLVDALAACGITLPQVHHSSVDTHLAKWVTLIGRAAGHLADPAGLGGRHWSTSMGVEDAARAWTGAAGMHHLYLEVQMEVWDQHFVGFMGRVTSSLTRWRAARV